MLIPKTRTGYMLALAGVLCFASACKKDKYTTKPQLEFKSAKNYTVPRGDLIEFTLEVRDKEGDISDTLYIQNRTASCPDSDYPVPAAYKVADIPSTSKFRGEIKVVFENGTNNTGNVIYSGNRCSRTDTTEFYFWIKDKENNVSDTVKTDKPIIVENQ